MSKSQTFVFSHKDLKKALSDLKVQKSMSTYLEDPKGSNLGDLAFKIGSVLYQHSNKTVCIEFKAPKAKLAPKKKTYDRFQGVPMPHFKAICHSIYTVRKDMRRGSIATVNPFDSNDPSQDSHICELYRKLEPYFKDLNEKGYYTSRESFYVEYLKQVMRQREYNISTLHRYDVLERGVQEVFNVALVDNDPYKHLTHEMISYFVKYNNVDADNATSFYKDPKSYSKFFNSIAVLRGLISEKNGDSTVVFEDLPRNRQNKYIHTWIKANIAVYREIYDSDINYPVMIGFISGENPRTLENSRRRFNDYLSGKKNVSYKAMPKKSLDDF